MSYIKKYRKLQITSVSGEKIVAGEVFRCCLVDLNQGRTNEASHGNPDFVILRVPII